MTTGIHSGLRVGVTLMKYLKTIGLNSNQPIGRGFNYPYDTAMSSDGRILLGDSV